MSPSRTILAAAGLATAAALLACAAPPAREGEARAPADTAAAAADTARPAPPPPADTGARSSLGFLSWEDLGIRLVGQGSTEGLRIDVTTLQDDAIALAGDDVRTYFREIKRRIEDAVPPGDEERLHPFLVAFTGQEKEVTYDPTRLWIESEGSTYYPRTIVPVSPDFDRRVVGLYQTVYAVYLFESDLDLLATLEFHYDNLSSGNDWRNVVQAIERARTRRSR